MSYEELEKLPDDCHSWWMLSWLNCLLSVLSFQDRVKQMKFIKYALLWAVQLGIQGPCEHEHCDSSNVTRV